MSEEVYDPNQMGREAWSPQRNENTQNQMPQQGQGQGFQSGVGPSGLPNGSLDFVRPLVENQINQAIDHYASQIPGGSRFSPEAKQAASGVLDGLQRQLEVELQNRLGSAGGLLGGNQGNQGSQNNQGGQL